MCASQEQGPNDVSKLAEQLGDAAGIEVTEANLRQVLGTLFGDSLDPSDPETYVVRNGVSGDIGFDFTQPRLMFQDSVPTITFSQYAGERGYVTIVHVDHAVERASSELAGAGYPHGLPYNEAQLRGLALAATRAADELAAANTNGGGADNGVSTCGAAA